MPWRRRVGALFSPNLLGLTRAEVSNAAWRAGVLGCSCLWLWLAFGLGLVAMQKLWGLSVDHAAPWAGAWLMGSGLLGLVSTIYVLLLLRDGWSRRRLAWRARTMVGAAGLGALSLFLVATFTRLLWLGYSA